jgi:SAM-dependent methyltransferase
MMAPEHYPPPLVTAIYTERRAPAVAAILRSEDPLVFDAGSGYGSESFLFAALGARVLAVDRSPEQTAIAEKRLPYWERLFERPLSIHFEAADLNTYTPPQQQISLTWIASVLAAIPDQDALLRRIYGATRPGGEVMITDMNLLNPLFLLKEWRRRRQGAQKAPEFAQQASLWRMFLRRGRCGARYFEISAEDPFDDAQFFWWKTLAQFLRNGGFEPGRPAYSGFMPPMGSLDLTALEKMLAKVPFIRSGAYFYRMSGFKPGPEHRAP